MIVIITKRQGTVHMGTRSNKKFLVMPTAQYALTIKSVMWMANMKSHGGTKGTQELRFIMLVGRSVGTTAHQVHGVSFGSFGQPCGYHSRADLYPDPLQHVVCDRIWS